MHKGETVIPGGGGGGLATTIPVVTSQPARLLRHSISDEELEMLGDSKRSGLSEFMWAMVAMATGAFPSAAVAFWDSYVKAKATPLGGLGLLNLLILGVSAALAALAAVVVISKGKSAKQLIKQIRERDAQ